MQTLLYVPAQHLPNGKHGIPQDQTTSQQAAKINKARWPIKQIGGRGKGKRGEKKSPAQVPPRPGL